MWEKIFKLFENLTTKNSDYTKIKIGALVMESKKLYKYDLPHEIHLIVPRVEIRKTLKTPFFTLTIETIFNSVTISDSPRLSTNNEKTLQKDNPT